MSAQPHISSSGMFLAPAPYYPPAPFYNEQIMQTLKILDETIAKLAFNPDAQKRVEGVRFTITTQENAKYAKAKANEERCEKIKNGLAAIYLGIVKNDAKDSKVSAEDLKILNDILISSQGDIEKAIASYMGNTAAKIESLEKDFNLIVKILDFFSKKVRELFLRVFVRIMVPIMQHCSENNLKPSLFANIWVSAKDIIFSNESAGPASYDNASDYIRLMICYTALCYKIARLNVETTEDAKAILPTLVSILLDRMDFAIMQHRSSQYSSFLDTVCWSMWGTLNRLSENDELGRYSYSITFLDQKDMNEIKDFLNNSWTKRCSEKGSTATTAAQPFLISKASTAASVSVPTSAATAETSSTLPKKVAGNNL
jgi:hypothetical protein